MAKVGDLSRSNTSPDMMDENLSESEFLNGEDSEDFDDELYDLELKDEECETQKSTHQGQKLLASASNKGNVRNDVNHRTSQALIPANVQKEEEEDIDSEEERDILKGIRDDIENKVREEMKEEVQFYKDKLNALEAGECPKTTDDKQEEGDGTSNDEEMDPRLKEALIRMQKLDRILNKKVKKEKQVKRDRILLERRMREEISAMKMGATHYREIKINTERFLALAPPPSHNEGVTIEETQEDEDLPPLFQTQIDDSEILRRTEKRENGDGDEKVNAGSSRPESTTSSQGESTRSGSTQRGEKKKKKKDFIKRNKELAAAAGDVIAMTDDEKKRVQDLLGDLDELPCVEEGDDNESAFSFRMDQLSLNLGEGFMPDTTEHASLTHIDNRLKSIMPEDDFNTISGHGSSLSKGTTPQLFTHVNVRNPAYLLDGFGERILYETKEERDLKARLNSIEEELSKFKAPETMENGDTDSHLTDEQLNNLLDQCARSMSRTSYGNTPDLSARSEVSSRQVLMENPPKLSEEQLQQLLSEAHFPMSTQLLSLRDDDDKISEEEGNTEVIRAETWKTIIQEDLDADNSELLSIDIANANVSQNCSATFFKQASNEEEIYDKSDEMKRSSPYNPVHQRHSPPLAVDALTPKKSRNFQGFPKIHTPNNLSRPSSNVEQNHSITSSASINDDFNDSEENVRLPSIDSSSFLIHTTQGLNNEQERKKFGFGAKQPLQTVHNNLSNMRLDSFSEDDNDVTPNQSRRTSNSKAMSFIPRPPSENQC